MKRLMGVVVVLGVGVMSGCAPKAAQTIPSDEALREKLAKEGNPTSWVFHAPPEKVVEAIRQTFSPRIKVVVSDGAVTTVILPSAKETESITNRCGKGGYVHPVYRNSPATNMVEPVDSYEAVLSFRLEGRSGGTLVTARAHEPYVTFYSAAHPAMASKAEAPFCCNWCGCLSLAYIFEVQPCLHAPYPWGMEPWKVRCAVPSNTVAEYSALRMIGQALGETDMPEARVPEIEVFR